MSLLNLHAEYYTEDGDLVLFQCAECGYTTISIGFLHSHVERHWTYRKRLEHFNPVAGGWDDWMRYTKVIAVSETKEITLDDVQDL